MAYDLTDDPYTDPDTGVMHNRLGIITANELARAEEATAAAMTTAILENVEPDSWNPSLLRDLHYKLFGQIYSWAGEYRTVEIGKGTSHFAASEHVPVQLETVLDALEQERQHWDPRTSAVLDHLAHYYSELNAIHPFREGNGRTIRLFLSLLANRYGWWLDWTAMTAEENVQACAAAFYGDETALREMMRRVGARIRTVSEPTDRAIG